MINTPTGGGKGGEVRGKGRQVGKNGQEGSRHASQWVGECAGGQVSLHIGKPPVQLAGRLADNWTCQRGDTLAVTQACKMPGDKWTGQQADIPFRVGQWAGIPQ